MLFCAIIYSFLLYDLNPYSNTFEPLRKLFILPSALATDAKTRSQILNSLHWVMAEMEKHETFTKWALDQGVKLHGVAAHRFPGRGLGIVATEAAPVCPIFFVSFSHDHAAGSARAFHPLFRLFCLFLLKPFIALHVPSSKISL